MQNHQGPGNGLFGQLRKYLPAAALTLLTLSLMIFFKYNKQEISIMIEEGKGSLVEFYTQNMKPLLFKTDISNEDVFNFALNKNIPIDKDEKKVLQINNESSDYDIFTIQPTVYRESTDNYLKFAQNLELSDEERVQVEAILESYKDEIYSSILVNENNVIAVNPRIIDLQKAIVTDIALFTRMVNENRKVKNSAIDFAFATIPEIPEIIEIGADKIEDKFIFFTPDTVFTQECQFDREAMKKELAKAHVDLDKVKERLKGMKIIINLKNEGFGVAIDSLVKENLRFEIDSSAFIVALPKLGKTGGENFREVKVKFDNISKILKAISFDGSKVSAFQEEWEPGFEDDWEEGKNYKINFNIDSLVNSSFRLINEMDLEEIDDLEIDIDSLLESFYLIPHDSLHNAEPRKAKALRKRN